MEKDVVMYCTHRVILESWDRRKVGRFQIYCDPDRSFPTQDEADHLREEVFGIL